MASIFNHRNLRPVNITTSLMFKKLLKDENGRILKETCPNHPHTHLIQFGHEKPFCPIEHDKKMDQESNLESTKFYYDQKKAKKHARYEKTKNFLYTHSILYDETIKKATFKNFSVKGKGATWKKRCKAKAKFDASVFCKPVLTFSSILAGPVGRGKSHLAMSMAKYVNDNAPRRKNGDNVTCMFVDTGELMRRIRDSYGKDNSLEETLIHEMINVYLLVLDDVGTEDVKNHDNSFDNAQSILSQVLNGRQDKRTIITTNENLDQIMKHYNPRIYSRMLSGSGGHIIRFNKKMPDMRFYRS